MRDPMYIEAPWMAERSIQIVGLNGDFWERRVLWWMLIRGSTKREQAKISPCRQCVICWVVPNLVNWEGGTTILGSSSVWSSGSTGADSGGSGISFTMPTLWSVVVSIKSSPVLLTYSSSTWLSFWWVSLQTPLIYKSFCHLLLWDPSPRKKLLKSFTQWHVVFEGQRNQQFDRQR